MHFLAPFVDIHQLLLPSVWLSLTLKATFKLAHLVLQSHAPAHSWVVPLLQPPSFLTATVCTALLAGRVPAPDPHFSFCICASSCSVCTVFACCDQSSFSRQFSTFKAFISNCNASSCDLQGLSTCHRLALQLQSVAESPRQAPKCNSPPSSWMQIYLFVTQSDLNISITDLYKRYMSFIIVHQVTKSIIKTQQNAYKVRSLTQSLRDNSLSSCTISLVAVKKPLSSDQHFAVLKPEPVDGLIEYSITLKCFDLYPRV